MSLYNDEDYFLQVDAHTVFEQDWDENLIKSLEKCMELSPKPLLSSYPPQFRMENGKPVTQRYDNYVVKTVVVNEQWPTEYGGDDMVLHFRANVRINTAEPVLGFHIAGGFVFTLGKFVYEVPYDPHLYFQGEEQNISVRAYTHGWDIYHTSAPPMYHLYATAKEGVPDLEHNQRETHWVKSKDDLRREKWWELDRRSRMRLTDLLHRGKDLGAYGLGKERTLKDFADFCGIDYINKTISDIAREPLEKK